MAVSIIYGPPSICRQWKNTMPDTHNYSLPPLCLLAAATLLGLPQTGYKDQRHIAAVPVRERRAVLSEFWFDAAHSTYNPPSHDRHRRYAPISCSCPPAGTERALNARATGRLGSAATPPMIGTGPGRRPPTRRNAGHEALKPTATAILL